MPVLSMGDDNGISILNLNPFTLNQTGFLALNRKTIFHGTAGFAGRGKAVI